MHKKRITFVSSHYKPESGAPAKRLSDIVGYLKKKDWDITVFTLAPNYPHNKVYDGYDTENYDKRVENNVTVIRIKPWLVSKDNFLLRILSESLFSFKSFLHVLKNNKPGDIYFASSPFMFLGPLTLLACKIRGFKFIWEVRDLTWEYAKSSGKKTFGFEKVLERLMRWTATKSDGLITATQGLMDYFKSKPKINEVIFNGISKKNYQKLSSVKSFEAAKETKPVVMYAGIIGYAQGLMTLIRTAKINQDINFVIVGDGPEKGQLESFVTDNPKIKNVSFTGYISFDELLVKYSEAHILIALLKDEEVYKTAQPSKIWEYMSTGKPVVYCGRGEASDILTDSECGIVVEPENPQKLSEKLNYLILNSEYTKKIAQRGQLFVKENRLRESLHKKLEMVLNKVVDA